MNLMQFKLLLTPTDTMSEIRRKLGDKLTMRRSRKSAFCPPNFRRLAGQESSNVNFKVALKATSMSDIRRFLKSTPVDLWNLILGDFGCNSGISQTWKMYWYWEKLCEFPDGKFWHHNLLREAALLFLI